MNNVQAIVNFLGLVRRTPPRVAVGSSLTFGLVLVPLIGYALDWPPVADAYLCVPDQATGFHYNNKAGEWQPANYKVKGLKYVIKRDGAGKPWTWASFDSADQPVKCEDDVYARENIVVVCHDRS